MSAPQNLIFGKLNNDILIKLAGENLTLQDAANLLGLRNNTQILLQEIRNTHRSIVRKLAFDFSSNNLLFIDALVNAYEKTVIIKDTNSSLQKAAVLIEEKFNKNLPPKSLITTNARGVINMKPSVTTDKYIDTYSKMCDEKIHMYLRLLRYHNNLSYFSKILETCNFMVSRCEDIYYHRFDMFRVEIYTVHWKSTDFVLFTKKRYIILVREFAILYLTMLIKTNNTSLLHVPLKYLSLHYMRPFIPPMAILEKYYHLDNDIIAKQDFVIHFLVYYFDRTEENQSRLEHVYETSIVDVTPFKFSLSFNEDKLNKMYKKCIDFILIEKGFKLKLLDFSREETLMIKNDFI